MRLILIAIITVIVGALGGVFYANRFGGPHPPQPVAAVTKPVAATKISPAASISQARQLELRRKRMRHGAVVFFAALDELGCDLDPANHDLYADDARYAMRYHMPDGSERVLKMSGTEVKAFGLKAAEELNLKGLECTRQGRYFDVGSETVRVREERILSADHEGRPVQIRQERTLIVKPSNDGQWRIQAVTGTGFLQ